MVSLIRELVDALPAFLSVFQLQWFYLMLFLRAASGPIKSPDDVVIATKFAAYPWRLTSGQFVGACKYSPNLFA
jgi:hypothetical protein